MSRSRKRGFQVEDTWPRDDSSNRFRCGEPALAIERHQPGRPVELVDIALGEVGVSLNRNVEHDAGPEHRANRLSSSESQQAGMRRCEIAACCPAGIPVTWTCWPEGRFRTPNELEGPRITTPVFRTNAG